MRMSEVIETREALARNHLPIPFGFILDPKSFRELFDEVVNLGKDMGVDIPTHDLKEPFQFMGFWFDRSDVEAK